MQQLKTVRHFRSMTPILRNEKKNWCIYNIWQQASPRTDLFILREIPPNFCCLQIPKVPIFPWHLIQRKIPFVVHKLFFFQTSRASFISFSPEFLKIGGFPFKKLGLLEHHKIAETHFVMVHCLAERLLSIWIYTEDPSHGPFHGWLSLKGSRVMSSISQNRWFLTYALEPITWRAEISQGNLD